MAAASRLEPTERLPVLSAEQVLRAASREPGPSRAEQIAAMSEAECRRGLAAKLRVMGAHGARHRRAPGRRPVRCRGSRRGSRSSRAGESDPDSDEPDGVRHLHHLIAAVTP